MSAIDRLKFASEIAKINAWLDSVGEDDPECRREVIEQSKSDLDTKLYYLARADEIIIKSIY